MAKIFISSTTEDLRDYRTEAVKTLRQLGHEVVVLEKLEASSSPPVEQSFAAIDSSDLFVSIIAWRYGYVPSVNNPDGRSFIELEFRYARDHGKTTLVFILKEEVPWPPQYMDSGENAARLAAFRQYLLQTLTVGFFTSPENLAQILVTAVSRWEHDRASRNDYGAPSQALSPATLPAGIDPFELAWRLVVDFKAEPALLRHMDPNALKEAVEKWAQEGGRGMSMDPSQWYEAAHKELQAKQTNLSPNTLWLAWMRATRTHLLPVAGDDHSKHDEHVAL